MKGGDHSKAENLDGKTAPNSPYDDQTIEDTVDQKCL